MDGVAVHAAPIPPILREHSLADDDQVADRVSKEILERLRTRCRSSGKGMAVTVLPGVLSM